MAGDDDEFRRQRQVQQDADYVVTAVK